MQLFNTRISLDLSVQHSKAQSIVCNCKNMLAADAWIRKRLCMSLSTCIEVQLVLTVGRSAARSVWEHGKTREVLLVLDPNAQPCWEDVDIDDLTNRTLLSWLRVQGDALTVGELPGSLLPLQACGVKQISHCLCETLATGSFALLMAVPRGAFGALVSNCLSVAKQHVA